MDVAKLNQSRGELLADLRGLEEIEENRSLTKNEVKLRGLKRSTLDVVEARLAKHAEGRPRTDFSALATTSEARDVHGVREKATRIGGIFSQECRALGEASGSGSFVVPDQYSSTFVDALTARSVGLLSGMTVLEMGSDTLHVPVESSDMTSAWVAEGGTISPSDPTFVEKVLLAQKLAAITVVSNEVLSDSNPSIQDLVANQLARSLALGLDLALFEGAGHGSNQPPGLNGTSGITTVSMGTNGAAFTNLDPIINAINAVSAANANPDSIVLHPTRWNELLLLKELTSTSNKPLLADATSGKAVVGTILGVPVYLSSQISTTQTQGTASGICSNAYVYDSSQVVVGRRQNVEIFLDPYSLSNTDQVRIRATARFDAAVLHAPAVARIIGIL